MQSIYRHAADAMVIQWFLSISKMPCIFDDHHKSIIYETLKIPLNLVYDSKPLVK
jgi:hypothetical protein